MLSVTIAAVLLAISSCDAAVSGFNRKLTFDAFDTDSNGYLSLKELTRLSSDTSKDGVEDITEFLAGVSTTGMSQQEALFFFYTIDSSDDQKIEVTEVTSIFHTMDANLDQSVAYYEYEALMNQVLAQASLVVSVLDKVKPLIASADANSDNQLTKLELWQLFSPADTDDDDLVSAAEFNVYWRNKTGDSEQRNRRLFEMFDRDNDSKLGSDADKNGIATAFDIDTNGAVSESEVINVLLYNLAKIMKDIEADGQSMIAMAQPSYPERVFGSVDTNGDGKMSVAEDMVVFGSIDVNKDGMANATEFLSFILSPSYGYKEKGALYIFFLYDSNNDMLVDQSEWRKIFYKNDRNGDQLISREEYISAKDFNVYQIQLAAGAISKAATMVDVADSSGDGELNQDEWRKLFMPADVNNDAQMSQQEFVGYWISHIGLDVKISTYMFHMMDSNGNGFIHPRPEQQNLFTSMDYNKNKLVSTEEFLNSMLWMLAKAMVEIEKDIATAFQGNYNISLAFTSADLNNDGYVQYSEYDAFLNSMDRNNDGEISMAEFVLVYTLSGLSDNGARYIFYRLDVSDDRKISKMERDGNFHAVDLDDDNRYSFSEFTAVMTRALHQMSEASWAEFRLSAFFTVVDTDKDGKLSEMDMNTMFGMADTNTDGGVNKDEFIKFWMTHSGETSDMSEILFGFLDADSDGGFGDDQEKEHTFYAFDYNGDNFVSKEEFLNSLLNLFAKAMGILDMQAMAARNSLVG